MPNVSHLRFRTTASALILSLAAAGGVGAAVIAPATPAVQPGGNPKPRDPEAPKPNDGEDIPAGSFDLRPKFRMGQDRRVRLSLDSKETQPDLTKELDPANRTGDTKNAAADEMKTKQDFVLIFRPTKVGEDGTSEVSIIFDQIRSHVEGPGVDDSFDSSKPAPAKKPAPKPAEADPLGGLGKVPTLEETLRPLVGEELSIVFDRDGNVIEVRGGEKFVRALNPMAPEELTQMGGDEKMRDLFKSIVSTPGKRSANSGETWSSDTALDLFPIGGSRLHTDYRLSNVQGAKGKISFQGKLVPSKDPSPGSGGLKLNKADYAGSTDWDQEDGFARSMQSTQGLDAELKIGEQTISLKQSQKVVLERLPDAKK
ncbi:MAG: DUF6263 family protein [Phycisphaerales bacterium]